MSILQKNYYKISFLTRGIFINPKISTKYMANSPAKVILFGEHFVVHGSYAIAAAIDRLGVEVQITAIEDTDHTRFSAVFNNQEVKEGGNLHTASLAILNDLKISKKVKVNITSNIQGSGLGASAAFCVAFAEALNEKLELGLEKERINELAYTGETSFHGNPSGIDNTACCYGGIILYKKGAEFRYNSIKPLKKMRFIIVNSGKKASTFEMVGKISLFREQNPELFDQYVAEITHLVDDAKDAMLTGELNYLGELMLINQGLLNNIGASTDAINKIITIGINSGALGGKLTGSGGGGNVILLYDNASTKLRILDEMDKLGYECFDTEIG